MAKKKQVEDTIQEEIINTVEETVEESFEEVVEEVIEEAPKPKKSAKKESKAKEEPKKPGLYHNGRFISNVNARLGRKWSVTIDGKREKILKSEVVSIE